MCWHCAGHCAGSFPRRSQTTPARTNPRAGVASLTSLRIQLQRTRVGPGRRDQAALSRFFRRDRIWSSRTCVIRIPWDPARCALASSFGISGSAGAELRAVGLRPGNRSLHATFRSGGSAKLSVTPIGCQDGAVKQDAPRVPESLFNIAHSQKILREILRGRGRIGH
jgi:hypothetical protein